MKVIKIIPNQSTVFLVVLENSYNKFKEYHSSKDFSTLFKRITDATNAAQSDENYKSVYIMPKGSGFNHD